MLINALMRLVCVAERGALDIRSSNIGQNRANAQGGALEDWIKDLFANSLGDTGRVRLKKWTNTFSYLGNQNNPPDMILKLSDAIEVKKVIGKNASLALNSSYPKSHLFADSHFITKACRNCEDAPWDVKDLLYITGVVSKDGILNSLAMVYGRDYCADRAIYERIRGAVIDGIGRIDDIDFAPTNELAKVKRVDPLGITDLRVRGM